MVHTMPGPTEAPAAPAPDHAAGAAADPRADAATPASGRLARRLDAASVLLPAALALFFSFQAGGFFAGSTGVAAFALALGLVLRSTLGHRPFAALTVPAGVAAAALAGYAVWILLSVQWSDAPGRALVEFNRALLYGLTFLACATLPYRRGRLAASVRWLVLATWIVCLAGLASHLYADTFPVGASAVQDRLSFPLSYWNGQGLIAALGMLLAVHLACASREPWWARALGAGAVPVLISALFFTFSRGAMLAAVVGLVAYVLLYRSRGLLTGAVAVLPPAVLAVLFSYDAGELTTDGPTTPAAIAQGADVALGVGICTLAALVLGVGVARWLDPQAHRLALPARARRPVRAGFAVAVLLAAVVVPLALGAPAAIERQFDRFVAGNTTQDADQRARLLNPGNNGRLDHWKVALDAWRTAPLRGTGAGTYQVNWNQDRELDLNVVDAHSLYVETLADLGLVGLGLIALALLTIAGAVLWRGQRRRGDPDADPSLDAILVAVFVAWGIHAGLDWIWETPALTAWPLALAGMALAGRVAAGGEPSPGRTVRIAVGLACLGLAAVPLQMGRSQAALDRSVRAFGASPQNCPGAIDAALTSLGAVGSRAEPWEIIAYCDIAANEPELARRAARNAMARDPRNWTYPYALALVQGATGEDPRPAARRALTLNPRNTQAQEAVEAFEDARPRQWPEIARRLRLPTS